MKTIQFGLAAPYDTGRYCGVATNSQFSIEVHNSEGSSDMWYHIGRINGATINWGGSHKYSNGYHPSIAINKNNVVVEVHETSNAVTNSIYYKVGIVNEETINWGSDDKYDSGKQPSVSINDNGVVVEVHKSQSYDTLYYRVGQINDKRIEWGDSHKYDDGIMPSVSINNNGVVVEVHKSQSFNKLYYRVGKINGKKINWGNSHAYQDGVAPSVGITNDEQVIEVHKSQGGTGLWQLVGQVNGSEIVWGASSNFDTGDNPQIGVSLNGDAAVQVHEGSSFKLWYSNSRVMDTANFMKNLLPIISNLPLKKMVLPATHDTGMYIGGYAGITQNLNLYGQLNGGARYFDLRLDGDLNIRHGIVKGPKLDEVLRNIQQFFDEGHQELAILKFSHFDNFSKDSYQNMRKAINNYLGKWLFKNLPHGITRLADVSMGTYLQSGKGAILVVVDDDWAINNPEIGYWVYRDWNSGNKDKPYVPAQGNLTVYDKYSDTTDLTTMVQDQFEKLSDFNGKCKYNQQVPCDLFLLSWTLTPATAVWYWAKDADRVLGNAMMEHRRPNKYGYFTNILYLDYFQYARPAFIADILLRSYNNI
jgi:hypothetical protein